MKRLAVLVVVLAALVCAAASNGTQFATHHARYWPLDRGNTATGWTTWYYRPDWQTPSTFGGFWITEPPSAQPRPFAPAGTAWFQATLAWDAKTQSLVVGCRGHGDAAFHLRLGRRSRVASCHDKQAWTLALAGVSGTARIRDDLTITVRRRA